MNELEKHALKAMKYDSLAEAEKLVGVGSESISLGMTLLQENMQEREDVLTILNDTHSRMSYAQMADRLSETGFALQFCERHDSNLDVFEIWWHADGILLTTESYDIARINMIQAYYNWVPKCSLEEAYRYTSSGGYDTLQTGERVWIGNYDGREGLFTHLNQLREHGYFLSCWHKAPFLWFVNYSEARQVEGYDYREINKRKLAKLTDRARGAIGSID